MHKPIKHSAVRVVLTIIDGQVKSSVTLRDNEFFGSFDDFIECALQQGWTVTPPARNCKEVQQ